MINWIEATKENIEKYFFEKEIRVYREKGGVKTATREFDVFSYKKTHDFVFLTEKKDLICSVEPQCKFDDKGDVYLDIDLEPTACYFSHDNVTHFALKTEYGAILPISKGEL